MKALERFATRHPLLFGLVIALLVLVAYTATAILAEVVASNRAAYEWLEAAGRLAASLFFVYVLWRFGWLERSGVTRPGAPSAWVITLIFLAYDLLTSAYGLFGRLAAPALSDPALSASVAANALTTGLLEEIPFRGLVLCAFLRSGGDSKRGVIRAVLSSSLLFGGLHVVHILLGRPVPQALLVSISAFLSGIVYAALVLSWKTIWPAVALHGVTNALVAMWAVEIPGFSETVPGLVLMIVLQLPLVAYGAYLLRASIRSRRA